MEREDDARLIQDVLSGDDTAFNTLVHKYQKGVHALCVAEDRRFSPRRRDYTRYLPLQAYTKLPTLRNPHQFAGWLYVIANRLCINWNQKQKFATQSLEDTSMKEIEQSAYTRYVSEKQETEARERRYEIVDKLLKKTTRE